MWDSVYDAQRNGPLVSFTRQLNPTIMDEPSDYSEATMKEVVKRYEAAAEKINASRTKNMTDSTVVYVLSESFSDPARVPGVKLNKDAIPEVRAIKSGTTSGLMLSSGYGGGTANLGIWDCRPEHGEFRLVSDQPVPAAGTGAALDADDQPDVGGSEELHRLPPV